MDKNKIIEALVIDCNNYRKERCEHIAEERGKMQGAEYMLNKIINALREGEE